MSAYPICGDQSRMTTFYYCKPNALCAQLPGQNNLGRYRKTVDDRGDVCEDKFQDCKC